MIVKFEPIEGFRALSHLGIILIHGCLYSTSHMPNEGGLWLAFYTHFLSKLTFLLSFVVDTFFAMSGYLLTYTLVLKAAKSPPSIVKFLIKRVGRTFPTLFVFLILSFTFLGDYFNKRSLEEKFKGLIAIFLLLPNYFGFKYTPLTFGPAWSIFVDIHGGILILIMIYIGRAGGKYAFGGDCVILAKRMKWIFAFAVIISVLIRGYLFDIKWLNELLVPKYHSYMFMLSPENYKWITDTYERKLTYSFSSNHVFI